MSEQSKVLYMNKPKRFSLDEARDLISYVRDLTRVAVEESSPLISELQRTDLTEEERTTYSQRLQERVDLWANEVAHLGAHPKGLWLVDFDSGSGFYCWRFDEPELEYFHGYDDGFTGRTPIQ